MISRLSLAIDDGLTLTAPVAFVNAPGRIDFAGIAPSDIRASTGNIMDHDRLAGRGVAVTPMPEATVGSSVVFCHRSKPATFDLIARALELTEAGGIVAVDGAKTDGIESVLKALKRYFDGVESFSKAHGKLIWLTRPETLPDLEDWKTAPRQVDGFWTHAGVFSADGIDKGSALLAKLLPPLGGHGADLGAGWGYLARHVLDSPKVSALDLIEADHLSLEMAQRNIDDPRATFHWADVMTHQGQYDFVVANPPFHAGRKPDPALGQGFITKAAQLLTPKGVYWMVANQNLPYEAVLNETFGQVETRAQEGGFKVIHAARPIRSQGGTNPHRLRRNLQGG